MTSKPYYQHDGITIYCGDCREILPALPKVGLVLTDPPYGIGADKAAHQASGDVVGHGHRRVAKRVYASSDWDKEPPSTATIEAVLSAGRFAIVWGGNYFGLPASSKWLVWDKLNAGNNFADCELAWTNLPGAVRLRRHLWNGMAREHCEVRYDHPTQKPVAVMVWCFRQLDDAVTSVDPFAGSGTTLVAAKRLGRQCIGIEIEEKYCEIAARRVDAERLTLFETLPEQESMFAERNI